METRIYGDVKLVRMIASTGSGRKYVTWLNKRQITQMIFQIWAISSPSRNNSILYDSEKFKHGLPLMKGHFRTAYYHQSCYLKSGWDHYPDINICMLSCMEDRVPKLSSTFRWYDEHSNEMVDPDYNIFWIWLFTYTENSDHGLRVMNLTTTRCVERLQKFHLVHHHLSPNRSNHEHSFLNSFSSIKPKLLLLCKSNARLPRPILLLCISGF